MLYKPGTLGRDVAHSFLGLLSGLIDIFAGIILSSLSYIFDVFPWLILLIPPILSLRGSIIGIMTGRISTGIHLGTVKPSIRKNTVHFYSLLLSVHIIRILGVILILLATISLIMIREVQFPPILEMAILLFITLELSSIAVFFIIMSMCNVSYKTGIDTDYILYPIASSTADIISITLFGFTTYVYGILKGVFLIIPLATISYIILFLIIRNNRVSLQEVYNVVGESMVSIISVAIIISFTAIFLKELYIAGALGTFILLIYPVFLTITGDAGSIFGSVLTTKLHMGEFPVDFSNLKYIARYMMPVTISYLLMLMICGLTPLILTPNIQMILTRFLPIILISGGLAIPIIIIIDLAIASLTFRAGLDPDHFTIPIITTLADNICTFSLLITVKLIFQI